MAVSELQSYIASSFAVKVDRNKPLMKTAAPIDARERSAVELAPCRAGTRARTVHARSSPNPCGLRFQRRPRSYGEDAPSSVHRRRESHCIRCRGERWLAPPSGRYSRGTRRRQNPPGATSPGIHLACWLPSSRPNRALQTGLRGTTAGTLQSTYLPQTRIQSAL